MCNGDVYCMFNLSVCIKKVQSFKIISATGQVDANTYLQVLYTNIAQKH